MFGLMQQRLCKNHSTGSKQNFHFNYCGTCKSIATNYGHQSRVFLNYDVVFLTALLNEFESPNNYAAAYYDKSCFKIPTKNGVAKVFEYTAAINIFLAYVKIKDNIEDSKFLNKTKWSITKLFYNKPFNKAKKSLKQLKFPVDSAEKLISTNFTNENKRNLYLKEYLNPTATITEMAFKHGAQIMSLSLSEQNLFAKIGKSLGEIVYCIDAINDIEEDTKNQQFNPILNSTNVGKKVIENHVIKSCESLKNNLALLKINTSIKEAYIAKVEVLKFSQFGLTPAHNKVDKQRKKKTNCYFDCCLDCCCNCTCDNCSCTNCCCDCD